MDTPNEPDVETLIENTRQELMRLNPPPAEESKEEEIKKMLDRAMSFADNVLKKLVAHTVGEELNDIFEECTETVNAILIKEEDTEEKNIGNYTLNLGIVDHDYILDLKHFAGNDGVKGRIVFLLNSVKILYNPIKDHMKQRAEKNNTEFNYVMQIDHNTNLFLDKDSKKRIGVIFTQL